MVPRRERQNSCSFSLTNPLPLAASSLRTMLQFLVAAVVTLHAVILAPETEAAHGRKFIS